MNRESTVDVTASEKNVVASGLIEEVLAPSLLQLIMMTPTYMAPSAWQGHIPFAFWLIAAHRPRVVVELGTHYGVSYFAFCQAIERLKLNTRCFAIDTWQGDQHAGFYGEDVHANVMAHNHSNYSGFSRLVKSTFDDALEHFQDGTIDLLHIDGLHSYEAVEHDFSSWLPKLSERSVVVLHDTNVRERGFGVFKLLDELKSKYPGFEFVHGHGLGVLGTGSEQARLMRRLFEADGDEHGRRALHDIFSRLGGACIDGFTSEQHAAKNRQIRSEIKKGKTEADKYKSALERSERDVDSVRAEIIATRLELDGRQQEIMRLQQDLARAAAEAEGLRAALVEEKVRSNAERTKLENLLSERFGEIATLTKLVVQIETGRSGLDGHSETKARSWIAPAFRSVWARIQAARLKRSGQFDAAYYLSTNPDVAKAGMDPALHYVVWGAKEGRRPNSGVASDDAQAMR